MSDAEFGPPSQKQLDLALEAAAKQASKAHLAWVEAKGALGKAVQDNHAALAHWAEAKIKAAEGKWLAEVQGALDLLAEEVKKRQAAEEEIQDLLRPGGIDLKVAQLQDQLRIAKREVRKLKNENEDLKRVVVHLNASTPFGAICVIDTMIRRLNHLSQRDDARLGEMNKAIAERKVMQIELEQTKAALAAATAPPPRRLPLP